MHVTTPDGPGTIEAIETFRTCTRYGIRLEKNPYSFPVAFYFENEIILTLQNETAR